MSNYEKQPFVTVKGWELSAINGYEEIMKTLRERYRDSGKSDYCMVFDTYPGVCDEEVLTALKLLHPDTVIDMKQVFKSEKSMTEQLKYNLTDDRVFGRMYYGEIEDLIDEEALHQVKSRSGKRADRGVWIWRRPGSRSRHVGLSGSGTLGDSAQVSEWNA